MAKPYQDTIDKAIAALTALRDRKISTSVKSQEDELESYHDAKAMAKDAHLICADLIIGLCDIAADSAGKKMALSLIKDFRDPHLIEDALYQADLWAEEYASASEAA